jgi:two-component system OmpR family sensor kinase
MRENLFLEMKNYSFFFDDERFDIDIVPDTAKQQFYELYFDQQSLYILVPFPANKNDLLKVFYPKKEYKILLDTMRETIILQFIFLSLIAILISLLFAFYSLSPLRKSLKLLETFIKDIIHDLNTPITSILINLKMMDAKNEEVESITKSTKTISMLHNNLNTYLQEAQLASKKFNLREVIDEQVDFFAPMYDYLQWDIDIEDIVLTSDKNAFSRVIYNILSNACKYNTSDGYITIKTHNNILSISNTSYGIKNPSKIFERFYKESDRGLGIGLHIVEELCKQLQIEKKLLVENNIVTMYLHLDKVTFN